MKRRPRRVLLVDNAGPPTANATSLPKEAWLTLPDVVQVPPPVAAEPERQAELVAVPPRVKRLPYKKHRVTANAKARARNAHRVDPGRLGGLRDAMLRDLRRRFMILKGRLIKLVVLDDAFGLKERKPLTPAQLAANRDVSEEARDRLGRWMAGDSSESMYDPELDADVRFPSSGDPLPGLQPGEFLHGTSDKNWASIKKDGLVPRGGPGADFAAAARHGQTYGTADGRDASVFVTSRPDVAAWFAKYVAETYGGHPNVIRVRVPPDRLKALRPDTQAVLFRNPRDPAEAESHGVYYIRGKIEPEWVEGRYVRRNGRVEFTRNADGRVVYVVVHFHDEMGRPPTANAFDPDEPRDEKGRWAAAGSPAHETHTAVGRLFGLATHLPGAVLHRVREEAHQRYAKLAERYGPGYAKAIIGAALVGLPVPVPGASMATAALAVGLAELHRLATGGPKPTANLEWDERRLAWVDDPAAVDHEAMTEDEVQAAGRRLRVELGRALADVPGELTENWDPAEPRDERGRWTTAWGEASALEDKVWAGGGFTYKPVGGRSPKAGVVVSLPRGAGYERPVPDKQFRRRGRAVILDYLKRVRDDLKGGRLDREHAHVGAWHDAATGRVVLDVNEVYPNREEAIRVGKQRAQDAVFDLGTFSEIDLREHGRRPTGNAGPADRRGDGRRAGGAGGADLQGDGRGGVTANAGEFAFETSAEQLEQFRAWLEEQFGQLLTGKDPERLWQLYVLRGYERGAGRAWQDFNKGRLAAALGDDRQADFLAGGRDQFLRSAFGRPETVGKVKLLASRTLMDLRNVTHDVATRMGRALADGLTRGANPREVADELVKSLDLGYHRADLIARTELMRAHSEAQLDAFEDLGVAELGVDVEFSASGIPDRMCPECADLDGTVIPISEAHGILPRHPRCMCIWTPAGRVIGAGRNAAVRNAAWEAEDRDGAGRWTASGGFAYPTGYTPPVSHSRWAGPGPNPNTPPATRPPLTKAEAEAVTAYTDVNVYRPLNAALKAGAPLPRPGLFQRLAGERDLGGVDEGLRAAFAKAPVLAEPIDVRRGIFSRDPDRLGDFFTANVNKTVVLPGYQSTSAVPPGPDPDAEPFSGGGGGYKGNVKFLIHAVRGLDVRPYSKFPAEDEVLLPHGDAYRVGRVERRGREEEWYVELFQLPPGEGRKAPAAPTGNALRPPAAESHDKFCGDDADAEAILAWNAGPVANLWREEDHPRAPDGKFGDGGGGVVAGGEAAPADDAGGGTRVVAGERVLPFVDPDDVVQVKLKQQAARAADRAAAVARELEGTRVKLYSDWADVPKEEQERLQQDWIDEHVNDLTDQLLDQEDWEPETGPDDLRAVAEAAGWDDKGVMEKAQAALDDVNWNEVPPSDGDRDYWADGVKTWYDDTRLAGEEAVRELAKSLERQGAPAAVTREVGNLVHVAREDVDAELDKTRERLREEHRAEVRDGKGREWAEEEWGKMRDEEKFVESGLFHATVELTAPATWKVGLDDDQDDADYRRSQAMLRAIQDRLTVDEAARRGVKLHSGGDGLAAHVWTEWKGSSTSPTGLLLQDVASKELGGRRQNWSDAQEGQIHSAAMKLVEGYVDRDEWERVRDKALQADGGRTASSKVMEAAKVALGYEVMRAHVRATWAASQYALREAGLTELPLYRGLMVDKAALKDEHTRDVNVAGPKGPPGWGDPNNVYEQLTDIRVRRNGAASTAAGEGGRKVANTWEGVGAKPKDAELVVLRVLAPAESVLSLPVFGQNVHEEQEVVLTGAKYRWDAWLGRAPSLDTLPVGGVRLEDRPHEDAPKEPKK